MKKILFPIYYIVLFSMLLPACRQKPLSEKRDEMIKQQIERRGITDPVIIGAFKKVPREEYVLQKYQSRAYDDIEAPFGFGETLNRPFEDAIIVHTIMAGPHDKVLEVGTGVGYLASLMSFIAKEVYTIEIVPEIADRARNIIDKLGFKNITVVTGDGFLGLPDKAPFDAIVLTCSPTEVPSPLVEQLKDGGQIILPLGGKEKFQELVLYRKEKGKLIEIRRLAPATFTPMKGKAMEKIVP